MTAWSDMRIDDLRIEHLREPRCLDEPRPRFAWILHSPRRGAFQSAYRIVVASSRELAVAGTGDVWDSGRVASARTTGITYEGPTLLPKRRYWWRVEAWDGDGALVDAQATWWETGFMGRPWDAAWLQPPASLVPETGAVPPCLFRRAFDLAKPISKARLYASALGVFEVWLNGRRVGDDLFSPGWTDYRTRVQYECYDIDELVVGGDNAVGVHLAGGWYSGHVAWREQVYGRVPAVALELVVEHDDGSTTVVTTDAAWRASASWVQSSDFLMGETQIVPTDDAPAWAGAEFDATAWSPAVERTPPSATLTGRRGPAVRRLLEVPAVAVKNMADGTHVFDLGQNMVGWARVEVPEGTTGTITTRHAEMTESDGSLYTANYRTARCSDAFTLPAGGVAKSVMLEPSFTFRGFRYVEVFGLGADTTAAAVTGIVVGSETEQTGSFECSNPMVDKLQQNIEWGQRGNFLEVPTDCPQRDERLGWTGDAQVFVRTACWNADVASFFVKWLDDVADARAGDGFFPDVAPLMGDERFARGAPGWADAGVVVPWVLYRRYGDVRFLERNIDHMVGYVRAVAASNPTGRWLEQRGMDYGDWLSVEADTPKDVLATAYFAHSAELAGRAARILGRTSVADEMGALHAQVRSAFADAYVDDNGRVAGETQTAYVLALAFELVPDHLRPAAAAHLVEDIRSRGWHLSTGFLGVAHLQHVLTRTGYLDVAYRLLEADSYPSWGYSIRHGATTIWERWDGWTEERGFQTPEMNSFNHYSLGSVGDWMFAVVGGIGMAEGTSGFERVLVQPRPGGSLTWARAVYRSVRGLIESSWTIADGIFRLDVTIPANVQADVRLPVADETSVAESGMPPLKSQGVVGLETDGESVVVTVGGGTYAFSGPLSPS